MTVDEIVKLLLYKVNVGSKKALVFRNFYVCETIKASFERKGNRVTDAMEGYGTNIPCTSLAGDKWDRREEAGGWWQTLCKHISLGDGCSVKPPGSLCLLSFKMLKVVQNADLIQRDAILRMLWSRDWSCIFSWCAHFKSLGRMLLRGQPRLKSAYFQQIIFPFNQQIRLGIWDGMSQGLWHNLCSKVTLCCVHCEQCHICIWQYKILPLLPTLKLPANCCSCYQKDSTEGLYLSVRIAQRSCTSVRICLLLFTSAD